MAKKYIKKAKEYKKPIAFLCKVWYNEAEIFDGRIDL